jgi:heat shock protein HslJ
MSAHSIRIAVAASIALSAVACSRQPATENTAAGRVDSTPAPRPAVDSASAGPALRGTDWRLVALGDKQVTVADSNRSPRILLQPGSKQMTGSGGCNRMFGVYELNGDALRFSGVGSTKMACKDGMDTEAAFLAALLRVKRWKLVGQQLELSDSTGMALARFEAHSR